jgi:hypothetical protein
MGRMLFVVGILAAGATVAMSQGIAIDSIDMKAIYAVGNRITYHQDTAAVNVDIGNPGGPATWNFSAFRSDLVEVRKSVPVNSTPYAANVPGATHALIDTAFIAKFYMNILGTKSALILNSSAAYYYYNIGDDLRFYRLQGSGFGHLEGQFDLYPFTAEWMQSPSSVELDLPVTYQKTWTSSYTDSVRGTASSLPLIGSYTFTQVAPFAVTYTVDGYGSLSLPLGEAQGALRIRRTNRIFTDSVEVWYMFVGKNGATVQMRLRDTGATGGIVAVDSIRWSGGVVDIPVPIQLASFSGIRVNPTSVNLEWRTLTETDNLGFFVQRKNQEGDPFNDLPGSFVEGHGTTVVPQTYSYNDLTGGARPYWYRLRQVDLDGSMHFSDAVRVDLLSDVSDITPVSFALRQNYPNPFNPTTKLGYTVGAVGGRGAVASSHVRLAVYDLLGREIATLVNEQKMPGAYEVKFDATNLPSGVYLCRMTAGEFSETVKLVLMR